jgi:hypothetical protein
LTGRSRRATPYLYLEVVSGRAAGRAGDGAERDYRCQGNERLRFQ